MRGKRRGGARLVPVGDAPEDSKHEHVQNDRVEDDERAQVPAIRGFFADLFIEGASGLPRWVSSRLRFFSSGFRSSRRRQTRAGACDLRFCFPSDFQFFQIRRKTRAGACDSRFFCGFVFLGAAGLPRSVSWWLCFFFSVFYFIRPVPF